MGKHEASVPEDTSGLVDIRATNIDELRSEAIGLFEEHWEELATDKGAMKLVPHWKQYYELEERDAIVALAAWMGDQMVGYSLSMVFRHLHYSELWCLQNDILFVKREYRRGGLGLKLIEATEEVARKLECGMILWHSKLDTTLGVLLEKRGYRIQDIIQSKML